MKFEELISLQHSRDLEIFADGAWRPAWPIRSQYGGGYCRDYHGRLYTVPTGSITFGYQPNAGRTTAVQPLEVTFSAQQAESSVRRSFKNRAMTGEEVDACGRADAESVTIPKAEFEALQRTARKGVDFDNHLKSLREEVQRIQEKAADDKKNAADRAAILAKIGLVLKEHGWHNNTGDYVACLQERIASSKAELQVERTRAAQADKRAIEAHDAQRKFAREVASALGMVLLGLPVDPAWPAETDVVRIARERNSRCNSGFMFLGPQHYQKEINALKFERDTAKTDLANYVSRCNRLEQNCEQSSEMNRALADANLKLRSDLANWRQYIAAGSLGDLDAAIRLLDERGFPAARGHCCGLSGDEAVKMRDQLLSVMRHLQGKS
jgi:hypothetical protein